MLSQQDTTSSEQPSPNDADIAATETEAGYGYAVHSLGEVLLWHRKHGGNISTLQREEQASASLKAVTDHIRRLLAPTQTQKSAVSPANSTQGVDEHTVAVMRAPELAESVAQAQQATHLMLQLERIMVARAEQAQSPQQAQELRTRCSARIGALALTAMNTFGTAAAPLLVEWTKRSKQHGKSGSQQIGLASLSGLGTAGVNPLGQLLAALAIQ